MSGYSGRAPLAYVLDPYVGMPEIFAPEELARQMPSPPVQSCNRAERRKQVAKLRKGQKP